MRINVNNPGENLASLLETQQVLTKYELFLLSLICIYELVPFILTPWNEPSTPTVIIPLFLHTWLSQDVSWGRNTFSSYARFIHLFICPKILLWAFNKSVEKMNSTIVLAWLRVSNVLAKTRVLLLPHSIPTHHEKMDLQNTYYLNHNCNRGWFISLWLVGLV